MEVDDDIPISALERFAYCPRQCALAHVDGIWLQNASTVAGNEVHARVTEGGAEHGEHLDVLRSVALVSRRLGLRGVADVVEIERGSHSEVVAVRPVEYKRGRRRRVGSVEIQLGAQAMALEEMTGLPVPEGAIYFAASKRRLRVAIDDALRGQVEATARAVRAMVQSGSVPAPVFGPKCTDCSFSPACQPCWLSEGRSLSARLLESLE